MKPIKSFCVIEVLISSIRSCHSLSLSFSPFLCLKFPMYIQITSQGWTLPFVWYSISSIKSFKISLWSVLRTIAQVESSICFLILIPYFALILTNSANNSGGTTKVYVILFSSKKPSNVALSSKESHNTETGGSSPWASQNNKTFVFRRETEMFYDFGLRGCCRPRINWINGCKYSLEKLFYPFVLLS